MKLRDWERHLIRSKYREGSISNIYVKTSSGRTVDLLHSFTSNHYDSIPSLRKMCLDSEVIKAYREGPYSYSVWIDLTIKSVTTYHTVEIVLDNDETLSSSNKFDYICAND